MDCGATAKPSAKSVPSSASPVSTNSALRSCGISLRRCHSAAPTRCGPKKLSHVSHVSHSHQAPIARTYTCAHFPSTRVAARAPPQCTRRAQKVRSTPTHTSGLARSETPCRTATKSTRQTVLNQHTVVCYPVVALRFRPVATLCNSRASSLLSAASRHRTRRSNLWAISSRRHPFRRVSLRWFPNPLTTRRCGAPARPPHVPRAKSAHKTRTCAQATKPCNRRAAVLPWRPLHLRLDGTMALR